MHATGKQQMVEIFSSHFIKAGHVFQDVVVQSLSDFYVLNELLSLLGHDKIDVFF